jgi:hypothetical protein
VATREGPRLFQYLQLVRRWRAHKAPNLLFAGDKGFDYAKLISRCRTQNEFNRLHIELENTLTPVELASIASRAGTSNIPEPSRLWLEKIRRWTPHLFDAPQHYERVAFSEHVILYQDHESDLRDKGLLVAFSGNARRLMMPVCVFLQHVDSRRWDIVVLKKCARNSYLLGLHGVATDFPDLVAYVQTTFSSAQYRRMVTLGTSSGGFPAAWAAVLLGADRGISVCGRAPRPLPALSMGDRPVTHQDTTARDEVDLCFVYGADCVPDHQAALSLLDLFGGRLRPVTEVDGHGVLGQLLKRGQFAEFVEEMLG